MPGERRPTGDLFVNQVTLIGSLSLHELARLDACLFPAVPEDVGGWEAYVHALRQRREDALQLELSAFLPGVPEAPVYDAAQGPAGYIQQVRQATQTAGLTRYHYNDESSLQRERFVKDYAAGYLARDEVVARRSALDYREDDLASFLRVNFSYLMITARVIARREYRQMRGHILEKFLPDLHYRGREPVKLALEAGEVTNGQLKAVKEALKGLPFRAPITDFFQLDLRLFTKEKPTRQAIITAFAKEVWELCELLHDVDPALLRRTPYRTGALAFLPVHELRLAIADNADNPLIEPAAICRAFLRYPHAFRQRAALLPARANRGTVLDIGVEILNLDA